MRPRSRRHWPPPPCLHHFVGHPTQEEGIGPIEVLDRVTMYVFVRDHFTMIAAPVQCDVDRIPKGSHCVRVPPTILNLTYPTYLHRSIEPEHTPPFARTTCEHSEVPELLVLDLVATPSSCQRDDERDQDQIARIVDHFHF